jgi:segregation and condensation protein A
MAAMRDSNPVPEFGDSADLPGELRLNVALDGYEGPLDLLLDLARREKVDLREISILKLADQYLAFISEAQKLRLELAGDYLVMAAWLTYLKSRLLLPEKPQDDAPGAEDMAADLAERLRRLEAIRRVGERFSLLLGEARETLPRGAAEQVVVERRSAWDLSLHDLVAAYISRRESKAKAHMRIARRQQISIPEAREILERLIGRYADWCPIHVLVAAFSRPRGEWRSSQAASFAAALELAREGRVDLKQDGLFADLYLKRSTRHLAGVPA